MKRAVVLVACCLLAAGCGGSKKPSDPGRQAVDELVAAAKAHDAAAIWSHVTKATQQRLGKAETAALVERLLGPFAGGGYRTVVSQLVTERYGVVAISTSAAIAAIPLAKEHGDLHAELGTKLRIEPSGPQPKVHTEHVPPQVAVEIKGGSGEPTAVLYLDGETLYPKTYGTGAAATVYANLDQDFAPGRHTVVAFVATPLAAAATAWAFTIAER